ncbi:MAG TPA: alkaline phosphatase D family protein [Phenylobacterium sp.]|uniref:alkaline phosphatase D family protein n=1 Tax=Phenylobacterium sp. TaxID=1871053 RepID=UPI002B469C82|nr:alkaline phosphatase D family protein [Phenylobacterium sp.]HKR87150.1 alkaline phosphatase D family protein [Phenylobacterium sp.]
MRIDRRQALGLLGAGVAGPAAAQATKPGRAGAGGFDWGVASGDPLQDRVILWTRCDSGGRPVRWEVAEDAAFKTLAAHGQVVPDAARDFTIKVDAAGLKPGRDYWYRFQAAGGAASPVGRTRTLPLGALKDLVLAVTTCSLYPNGYFNAYGAIAALPRVDVVLHLGDYIYEYGGPGSYGMDSAVAAERPHDPPHECLSIEDYRRRHAQYKTDPQLQAAHARAPWIVVWDDHESANDSWVGGAENHQPATEGDWNLRKAAAIKAYYEWMPIREPKGGGFAIWRSFDFGDLASLFMFETRLTARDHQLYLTELPENPTDADLAAFRKRVADPSRKMMSAGQEAWLADGLKASVRSGRPWQVLGNQVVMAQLLVPSFREAMAPDYDKVLAGLPPYLAHHVRLGQLAADHDLPYMMDSWEGYPADRERLYRIVEDSRANCIVVSGDSHAFWANELQADGGAGRRVAVEFGTTAITSPGDGDYFKGLPLGEMFAKRNREVRFCDQSAKGFVLLTLTHEAAVGELIAVSTIVDKTYETRVLKRYRATPGAAGVSGLTEV